MQAPMRVKSGPVLRTRALTYRVSMNVEKPPALSAKRVTGASEKQEVSEIALPAPQNQEESEAPDARNIHAARDILTPPGIDAPIQ
ncbi:hypothetical protein BH09CHL1_BH09CHL1_15880 [soil metagenome]